MQRAWRIAGGVFAALFVVWAYESWQLSFQDALGPGPGFFPFCLAIIGVALGIALIFQNPYAAETSAAEGALIPPRDAMRKVILVVAGLIAATALLDVVGYRIAVAAFCIFLLYILGARNWWVIIAFALVASFGIDELFSDLLKVPLPGGLIQT